MIKDEYERFLHPLNSSGVGASVLKIANLVHSNFKEVSSLGTAHGKRIQKVVQLATSQWDSTVEFNDIPPSQHNQSLSELRRLKSISLGPFRGFEKRETLSLDSNQVLLYGPNGSGKSSFCEALEYGLIGNVEEANNKRFKLQREYLKNAHTETFTPPEIRGTDRNGNDVLAKPSASDYRFCFIEKNRIDNFSRIAAQSPTKQTELISILFGLDSFNDFVKNFSLEIDEKYIDLKGVKSAQLATKRIQLKSYEAQLKDIQTHQNSIIAQQMELAEKYRSGTTFAGMLDELNGNSTTVGTIQNIESKLQRPIATKSGLTWSYVQTLKQSIDEYLLSLQSKRQELNNSSLKLSFKSLYSSLIKLQEIYPNTCPACKTPISQTLQNPYTNASAELKTLEYLAQLESEVEDIEKTLRQSLTQLLWVINKLCDMYTPTPLKALQTAQNSQPDGLWYQSIFLTRGDNFSLWQHIEAQVKQAESTDTAIAVAEQNRRVMQENLNRARDYAGKAIALVSSLDTLKQTQQTAQSYIDVFESQNRLLIEEAEKERSTVSRNHQIVSAYSVFVQHLNRYMHSLPIRLVEDLSEQATALYNAFNRYDADNEKLASIKLPLNQNERLQISYRKDSLRFFDALHVLSEGHIRCVGLAILLAKNINTMSPFVVFDDPVNAIDDEHRRAIRETLFIDDFFKGKQIVLACHGEEFFKDIHQTLGADRAKKSESYIFLPREGDFGIQIISMQRPKNYLLAAVELHKCHETRDALMSARRALEHLCNKTWRHYSKYCTKDDGLISVSKRDPLAEIDLRLLAENLKTKVKKAKGDIPHREEIVEALETALQQGGGCSHWTYYNKGTHEQEDRPEFDHNTVGDIVQALVRLENALN